MSNLKLINAEKELRQNKTLPKEKHDKYGLLEEQVNKESVFWNIKLLSQIKLLHLNELWFAVPKHWLEEGKGVQHPFKDQ